MSSFEPGDLIYSSKPYVYVLSNDVRGKRCDYCFFESKEIKRCSQCSFVYFCNRECQAKAWESHKEECRFIKNASPNVPSSSLRLIANILFKIKKQFKKVSVLYRISRNDSIGKEKNVQPHDKSHLYLYKYTQVSYLPKMENAIQIPNPFNSQKFGLDEPFEMIHGHKMNFRRLMSHAEEMKKDLKACQQMVSLSKALKDYIGEGNVPSPSEFIEIFGKMCVNTFSICDGEMQSIGCGIYLGASIFDHSCEPDAEVVFDGITICIRAVKNIPHTDVTKIYISYIEQLQLLRDRRQALNEQYYFLCQCPRCTSSYHEDLMTKTCVHKNETEELIMKFKTEFQRLKQMKKENVSAMKIFDACLEVLEKQDGILENSHIYHIKVLEIAFDACVESNQWADAITIGKQLIEPYKLLYGTHHPTTGIHFFKIGKIQNFQGLTGSAKPNLLLAEDILKITHGKDHPLYKNLLETLHECQMSNTYPQLSED